MANGCLPALKAVLEEPLSSFRAIKMPRRGLLGGKIEAWLRGLFRGLPHKAHPVQRRTPMPLQCNVRIRPIVLPVGPSIAYVKLTKNQWAIIDADDACVIGKFNWHAAWNNGAQSFYAYRNVRQPNGKQGRIGMHVAILNPPTGKHVDHIFSRTLDNRRSQLREATRSQNMQNRKTHRNNKCGIKGVAWQPGESRWIAKIKVEGKTIYLGRHHKIEDAANARKSAELRYFGDFSHAG